MTHRNGEPPELPGRVVLGVDCTLSGLQALRVAVAEARRRQVVLHAVRAAGPGPPETSPTAPPVAALGLAGPAAAVVHRPSTDEAQLSSLATAAAATVVRAFAETMGGQPPDVQVQAVVRPDTPGPVLVEYAHRDDDLLVIGTGQRGLLRRLRASGVVRYCLARAACPVLVVPPPPLTRAGSPRSLLRQLRREIDQLAEGGADR
jgi:nucleotide-binding universal stress UspA family protein